MLDKPLQYIGETLWLGKLGHLAVILCWVSILFSTYFYFHSLLRKTKNSIYLSLARSSYIIHFLAIILQFFCLFYIIKNHLYEYKYAYLHSDNALPWQYLLSCFWEGQEGSFLLWIFWNGVLGIFILARKNSWEKGLLGFMGLIQLLLLSFLLGFYFWGSKVGLNTFALLRDEMNWPFLNKPDYLLYLKDGTGLNTLLQNYWMVIHPPILFLGFASLVVPWSYVCTSLLIKDYHFSSKILPSTNFALGVLGLGIMMGSAWAYESLSFGGYWAWDPVENASLVPWLLVVAALHANLLFQRKNISPTSSIFLFGLSFIMVVYSSFLTRSGILGDTSVHAFTDLGMNTQLLIFFIVVSLVFLGLFFYRYSSLQKYQVDKVMGATTRQCWMFIFCLIQTSIALIIIGKTSLPVFNKIFSTSYAPAEDVKFSYNSLTIFLVIFICFFSGFTQYLTYKDKPIKTVLLKLKFILLLSLIISLLFIIILSVHYSTKGLPFQWLIYIAIFSSIFGIISNGQIVVEFLRKHKKEAGVVVVHSGFCLMILGILISSAKQEALIGKYLTPRPELENTSLFEDITIPISKYKVTYMGDSVAKNNSDKFFIIHFADTVNKKSFYLKPQVAKNNKGNEGFSANPDVKHFGIKIYSFI